MTWNDRLSFCQNDRKKKNASQCVENLPQMIISIFIHLCFDDKYILFTEFRIKLWNNKSGFFFKKFVVCFNLIKAVFSSNARKMRVTSLSFNLELWFVTWFCAENCFDQIRTINNEIPQLMWVLLTTVYTTKQILQYNNSIQQKY